MKLKILCLLSVALMSACTLDPAYRRPDAPVAANWTATDVPASSSTVSAQAPYAADIGWRDFFKDPRLQRLIELALQNNRDLRVASLDVAEYEAQYRIARANLGPTLDADGSNVRERTLGVNSNTASTMGTTSEANVSVGVTSWEVDFWGRLRSLKRQALEQYLETDASRQSTQLTLVATVATDYLQWLSDQTLMSIAADTVDADLQSDTLTESSEKLGNSSMQDVRTAQSTLAAARATLASYARAVEQDRNALVTEIGCPLPDDLPAGGTLESQGLFVDVGAGLPSDLLTRRPDIIAAEHTLKAANANVGAARAAFFPKIELTATAGTTSTALSSLFKAGTGAWAFEPSISVPIFDYGYNKANLDVAQIEKKIEIADYEKAIQSAFEDVANALAGRRTYVEQVKADRDYAASAQNYYELAQARYAQGTDSLPTLLSAQVTRNTAQTQLDQDRLAQLSNLITLYKALGGGWQEHSAKG